ncbi:GAF and ANTAR domain-containing protein [Promicromonospora sp. NPDC050249]|uniref:GAF and ANTAR domain-containing protein n=1 Tax=Promicromonospora sp. NPDC050249 TaxID=3154743 RepID=UPI0033EFCA7C
MQEWGWGQGRCGPMNPPELLSRLVRNLAETDDGRPLLTRLCEACVDTFQAQGGALTVSAGRGEQAAVSTPGVFEDLEPLQEVLGEGPVHQAMADDRVVAVRIGSLVDEYPVFSQLTGAVGGEATLYAVPMRGEGRVVGALSMYVTADPRARSSEDLQFVADAVGTILLGNAELLDWSERSPFHLATGMVVAQLGIGPDDASAMIRAHAFSRSTSLLSAAQDVLERRVTFSYDD